MSSCSAQLHLYQPNVVHSFIFDLYFPGRANYGHSLYTLVKTVTWSHLTLLILLPTGCRWPQLTGLRVWGDWSPLVAPPVNCYWANYSRTCIFTWGAKGQQDHNRVITSTLPLPPSSSVWLSCPHQPPCCLTSPPSPFFSFLHSHCLGVLDH